jgi:hypothetical protein
MSRYERNIDHQEGHVMTESGFDRPDASGSFNSVLLAVFQAAGG